MSRLDAKQNRIVQQAVMRYKVSSKNHARNKSIHKSCKMQAAGMTPWWKDFIWKRVSWSQMNLEHCGFSSVTFSLGERGSDQNYLGNLNLCLGATSGYLGFKTFHTLHTVHKKVRHMTRCHGVNGRTYPYPVAGCWSNGKGTSLLLCQLDKKHRERPA